MNSARSRVVTRRDALKAGGTALGAVLLAPMINLNRYALFAGSPERQYSARTVRLMERTNVIEMLHLLGPGSDAYLANPDLFPDEQLEKYRESAIDVFHITIGGGGGAFESALIAAGRMNGFVARHHRWFTRVTGPADLVQRGTAKMGIILGFQNSDHFRTVDDVDFFHGLGQRVSQLTYNTQNRIGTGCMDRRDDGLSDFGVDVVTRMNEVGMAVDVAHCGDRTSLDAFEASTKPVLVTHANVRALVPGYPRNKTDEALRKMAANGGAIGLTSVRSFVRDREPTTIEHLLDHYEYVARLVGVEHVGIGSDHSWEGYDVTPEPAWSRIGGRYREPYAFRHKIDMDEMTHAKRTFEIVEGLVRRGWSDAHIEMALGGNFQRILTEIWDVPHPRVSDA